MCERIIDFLERSNPKPLARLAVFASAMSAPDTIKTALETGNKEPLTASTVSFLCSVLALVIAHSDYRPRKME